MRDGWEMSGETTREVSLEKEDYVANVQGINNGRGSWCLFGSPGVVGAVIGIMVVACAILERQCKRAMIVSNDEALGEALNFRPSHAPRQHHFSSRCDLIVIHNFLERCASVVRYMTGDDLLIINII